MEEIQANYEHIKKRFSDLDAPRVDSQYIIATPVKRHPKTWEYMITTRLTFDTIGAVKWIPEFRKYGFVTIPEVILLDPGCMRSLTNFCEDLNQEHIQIRATIKQVFDCPYCKTPQAVKIDVNKKQGYCEECNKRVRSSKFYMKNKVLK